MIDYIQRKTMLYKTGVEYGDYTMNHVLGCAHGCRYPCYAYLQKKRFGQVWDYENWCHPYLVENTMELLDKEIPRLKKKIKSVQLCFTTDPFMYGYPEVQEMSTAAIRRLNADNIKCLVLTKGILPIELKDMHKENEYGITLITVSEKFRQLMEPGAAPIHLRLNALRNLHEAGCKTWVSIEPYPTPNIEAPALDDILANIDFVDRIIFGRMNYNKMVTEFKDHKKFYNNAAREVMDFCYQRGIDCHIKDGTITEG